LAAKADQDFSGKNHVTDPDEKGCPVSCFILLGVQTTFICSLWYGYQHIGRGNCGCNFLSGQSIGNNNTQFPLFRHIKEQEIATPSGLGASEIWSNPAGQSSHNQPAGMPITYRLFRSLNGRFWSFREVQHARLSVCYLQKRHWF